MEIDGIGGIDMDMDMKIDRYRYRSNMVKSLNFSLKIIQLMITYYF